MYRAELLKYIPDRSTQRDNLSGHWTRTVFYTTEYPDDNVNITDANLQIEVGKSGSFSFTILPTNEYIDEFETMNSYVDIYRNDDIDPIFSGRVISITEKFDLSKEITCEGLFGLLNDNVAKPFTFGGETGGDVIEPYDGTWSLYSLLYEFINDYNKNVEKIVEYEEDNVTYYEKIGTDKLINLGVIYFSDDVVYRKYQNYETTISRLDELVDSYGGAMTIRKTYDQEEGLYRLYLDWADYDNPESGLDDLYQEINFGDNLLDVSRDVNVDELITVLIPIGAQKEPEESEEVNVFEKEYKDPEYVMLTDDPNNPYNYVENVEAIRKYGRIIGVNQWDDVTEPANLKTKAEKYLLEKCKDKVTVTVNALDLANAGEAIENFNIGKIIKVNSPIHGFEGKKFVVKKLSLNLLDPTADELELGDESMGYVASERQYNKSVDNKITKIESNYVTNQRIYSTSTELYSLINQTAEAIALEVTKRYIFGVEEDGRDGKSYNEYIQDVISGIYITPGDVQIVVEDTFSQYFDFTDRGLIISQPGKPAKTIIGSDDFVFEHDDVEMLKITSDGISTKTVESYGQFTLGTQQNTGGQLLTDREWSIRLGAENSYGKHNLNIVWIGGNVNG